MPRNTDLPLCAKFQRFIQHYIDTKDIDKAGLLAGMDSDDARRCYRTKDVRAAIDKQVEIIDREYAIQRAKSRNLTAEKLDAHLVQSVEKENGIARVRAMELGYKRLGLIRDKVEHTGEGGGPLVFQLERIGAKVD